MSYILQPDNGRLVAIKSVAGSRPGVLSIPDLTQNSAIASVIVTSFDMDSSVAHQVSATVGGPEYLYVFGDALGIAEVGLVVYPYSCDASPSSKGPNSADKTTPAAAASGNNGNAPSSFAKVWNYYTDNRITPDRVKVLSLTFCGVTIKGLLVGFRNSTTTQGGSAVIRGTLRMRAWVDPTSSNAGK